MRKQNDAIEFYNQFATRQKQTGINERHRSILNKVVKAGLSRDHRVLEIGCGIGTVTKLLVDYVSSGSVFACDFSPENIKIAQGFLKKYRNLTLEVCDATDFLLEEQFDVIIMPDVIEHIPLDLHERMFNNMANMLSEDGFIFIHIPNPFHTDYCYQHGIPLQIIDQAVHLDLLLQGLKNSALYIAKMEIYSVWLKEGDYEYVILRKKSVFNNFTQGKQHASIITRIKEKIRYEWARRNAGEE